MATSTISNTILDPNGVAIANVPVTVRLMPSAGFRVDTFTEVARVAETTSNGSGFWSLALERNSNITPGTTSTWYEVTEAIPNADGGTRTWTIQVGASDQTVLASLVTPAQPQPTVVPAGTTYISQASGDARYQAVGSLGSGTPAAETPDHAGTAGVATSASRSDHIHPITAGTPASIGLAGTNAESSGTGFARDLHVHAYNPPACRVYNSATQSCADALATALTFNSERYDTDSMHSTVSNTSRITINTAGVYIVGGGIVLDTRGDYFQIAAQLRINGTTTIASDSLSGNGAQNVFGHVVVVTTYKFIVGDYIELLVYQDNSANAAVNSAVAANYGPEFHATWIGVG